MTPELAIRLILYAVVATSGLISFSVLVTWKHKLAHKLAFVMAALATCGLINAVLLVAKAMEGNMQSCWHNWVYIFAATIQAVATMSLAISLLRGPENGKL